MPNLDFEFYVGGIEDGILEVLTEPMKATPLKVKVLTTYDGQLESPEDLKKAVASQDLSYPFVMVGYAGGDDVNSPATSTVFGARMHFRHECGFTVIVADDNSLGQKTRRRDKCYPMISKVLETLTGLRLVTEINDVKYTLNTQPFRPEGVMPIRGIPDVTAYGIPFETAFSWSSPDRSEEGIDVTEIVVGVNALNNAGNRRVLPELPGVTTEVGNS